MTAAGPGAGWYFDAATGDREKYWNGQAWTGHWRSRPSPIDPAPLRRHAARTGPQHELPGEDTGSVVMDGNWIRLGSANYVMHIWHGSDQLTYRATHEPGGWMLKRWVAGAANKSGLVIADGLEELGDALIAAESDIPRALI